MMNRYVIVCKMKKRPSWKYQVIVLVTIYFLVSFYIHFCGPSQNRTISL